MEIGKPRFVVIGPGAIGGATAALLARARHDVTLVCKSADLAARVRDTGLRIRGARGSGLFPMQAVAAMEDLHDRFDYALIAVKATDLEDAARRLLPFLGPQSLVVSMQNGICVDALAAVIGPERVVGCSVGWGSTLLAPADIDVTSTGELVIGTLDGTVDARLEKLGGALQDVFPTQIVADIVTHLYSKLIVNSCITSVGALCGLTLGEMMGRGDCRRLFIAIMREAIAVADAIALRVPPYAGKLDYYALLRGSGPLDRARRNIFLRIFGSRYKRLRSSSLQSLERGRKTEIDFFNGYIVRRGARRGVDAPVNARITAMVHEIEHGTRRIGVANLAEASPGTPGNARK
jgi:2-dehydropantoate 2-reductase